jgi:hypothetical protein
MTKLFLIIIKFNVYKIYLFILSHQKQLILYNINNKILNFKKRVIHINIITYINKYSNH